MGLFICVSWFIEICSKQTLGRCCPNRPMFTDLLIPWPWKPSTAVPFGGLDIPWSTCPPSWLRFVPGLSSWWGEEAQIWKKKWFYLLAIGVILLWKLWPMYRWLTYLKYSDIYRSYVELPEGKVCNVSKAIINHLSFTPSEHVWLNYYFFIYKH